VKSKGILQDDGETILAATRNPGRCALELEHCLQVISETIEELPSDLVKAAKVLRALVDPKAKQGRKDFGAGTVLIVANETREPCSSSAMKGVRTIWLTCDALRV
jgi:hypothetical protein